MKGETFGSKKGSTYFFFSSRRRHTRLQGDLSSDVCSSDLINWEKTYQNILMTQNQSTCIVMSIPYTLIVVALSTSYSHLGQLWVIVRPTNLKFWSVSAFKKRYLINFHSKVCPLFSAVGYWTDNVKVAKLPIPY